MSGATHPLPNTPSWCGAQLKHRDNFFVPIISTGEDFKILVGKRKGMRSLGRLKRRGENNIGIILEI
jgi:hypothetical protein